jgi:DNA polymerase-3 subunit delta
VTSRPTIWLLWGEDPFLLRQEALGLLTDVQAFEVEAADWQGGETGDLATPSLFGDRRALLVNDCRSLPDHALAELKHYLAAPEPSATLILVAQVADRGKPPAALLKVVEPVGEVRNVAVPRKDLPGWVAARAKAKDIQLAPDGAKALVDALAEPAAIVQALDQLASAFPDQRITRAEVASQFRGLGEQKVWDLCDRAFSRDLPGAMRSLRALLDARDDPLMILGGIASRLRDLIKVRAAPANLSPAELARRVGLRFDWQARRYREQASRFSLEELESLHDQVVEADRALKTGGTGDVVLPLLVVAMSSEA